MIEWKECEECRFLFFPDRATQRLCDGCECAHESGDGTNEADVITVLEGL